MNEPRPTAGLRIGHVRLIGSAFQFVRPPVQAGSAAPIEAGGSDVTVQRHDDGSGADGAIRLRLTVSVEGRTEHGLRWQARVTYGAPFKIDDGAETTADLVRTVHGPAILYAFAREHIADLVRRADLGQIILPPMNFSLTGRRGPAPNS